MSDDATTRPEPPAVEPRQGSGSSGLLAVLLGGFIAGGIGYLAAYYTEFDLFQADRGGAEIERLSAAFDAQADRLSALEESAAAGAPSDEIPDSVRSEIGSVADTVAAISARLDQIEASPGTDATTQEAADSLAALQDRLARIESQTGDPSVTETDASQSQQLSQLSQRLDELSGTVASQAEKIARQAEQINSQTQTIDQQKQTLQSQSQAIDEAKNAARRETIRISAHGAVAEIRGAIESGEPYVDAIGEIRETSDISIPEALSGPAGSGVASIASLQENFPAAAREALSASVAATAGGGVVDRLGAFIRSQTGARSLGEQQGEGPDAILSRAEARLGEGKLEAALGELDALPEEGRQAMSDWIARARERLAARQALSDLSQSVNSI